VRRKQARWRGCGANQFFRRPRAKFLRRAARFDAGHFEEGKNRSGVASQTSGSKSGMASNVADGGGAGFQQLMRAAQPGAGVIGIAPAGLGGGDGGDPVGEGFRRRQFAGHVGVIEMAVGVDEAGQQDDFAEIEVFRGGAAEFFPRCDGADFISVNENRAVLDGRRGDGENDFRPQDHSSLALPGGCVWCGRRPCAWLS
jgi:hypothetical protein